MLFDHLNLIEPILKALQSEGYTKPTPIQTEAIPLILKHQDVLGVAQTGTGKTAAFAIPIIQILHQDSHKPTGKRNIRSLILTPTRELALQIGESFANYGKNTDLKCKVIFGGVNQHSQVEALKKGVDVVIATPGRLLDLMNQKFVDLSHIQIFVLDEADRMLDMGFVHDVKKVISKLPTKRQSLFFSATMSKEITSLAKTILVNPIRVEVTPVSSTAHTIKQSVFFVDTHNKKYLLIEILRDKSIERVLVFTRTKHGADKIAKFLISAGITSQAIHGNKSQNNRQNALNNFKSKLTRVLVATDIAARWIDIDELTHVINFELPNISESYVHRIGRTGRAGANGIALAFCDAAEKEYLRDIEKLIAKKIPIIDDHPYPLKNHDVVKAPAQQRPAKSTTYQEKPSKKGPWQLNPKDSKSAPSKKKSTPIKTEKPKHPSRESPQKREGSTKKTRPRKKS